MSKTARLATTAGAFVAAGVAATLLNDHQRTRRRRRRGEDVDFGTVHSPPLTLTATDGTALNVEIDEGPRKTPTIVFVHGWLCTLDAWHYQRLALRGRVRMVFVDLRSHGHSGRAHAASTTLDDLADDLGVVLETCAARGPVILVGHSMGGMAIMKLVEMHPQLFGKRIQSAVLLSTSAGDLVRQSPGLRYLVPLLRTASPLIDWGRSFNSYSIIRRWGLGPRAAERHVDMSNEMIRQAHTHVISDFYPNISGLDLYEALETLGEIDTTVVCGTKDLLTPIRHARVLAERIPGARLVEADDTGHMIMLEEHDLITTVIEDAMDKLA